MAFEDRHGKGLEPELISDSDEKDRLEAKNGILQLDAALHHIESVLQQGRPEKLRASLILRMNRFALKRLSRYAGLYRPGRVEIGSSQHTPPAPHLVPVLVEEL
jgi:hypothetical protein